MELSCRMKQVADMVEPCQCVADIGCDHGYISIYLTEQGIAKRALAMDVRTGPLSHAQRNIKEKHLEHRIQCRLSDGLMQLQPGEADTIVIAGMGGPLMVRILEDGAEKRIGTETFILQPQSEIPDVRRYLHRIGYAIVEEAMLLEDGKYYTVMKAVPVTQEISGGKEDWTVEEYQYGKYLMDTKSSVLLQYLQKEEKTLEDIVNKLRKQETNKAEERLQEMGEQLKRNREAQKIYETKNHN